MNPSLRRVIYAVSFESVGLVLSTAFMMVVTDAGIGAAGSLSVVAGLIALGWNYIFNWIFEIWEARQTKRGRPLGRRLVHGFLFEASLTLLMLPLLIWWLSAGFWTALGAEIGLLALWGVYTVAFTWLFDRIFGLPASAR